MHAPSGRQYVIRRGRQRAVIVEVGGGVREYAVGARPVLQPYPEDAICDGAHGTPLVPWPNRLGEGRYRFDGTEYQVPLTEPEKNNAIHGFLRWRPWQAEDHRDDRVTMRAHLHPRPGYPFDLGISIRYELSDQGLIVTATAENHGLTAAPYGYGQHPYLSPGSGRIDDAVLQFSAASRVVTDPKRQLPTGTDAVADNPFDFRDPHPIGPLEIDYAFLDLDRDDDGCAWVHLRGPDDSTSETMGRPVLPLPGTVHRRHPRPAPAPHRPRRRAHDLPTQRAAKPPRPHPARARAGGDQPVGRPAPALTETPVQQGRTPCAAHCRRVTHLQTTQRGEDVRYSRACGGESVVP